MDDDEWALRRGARLAEIIKDVGARHSKRGWRKELAEAMGISASYISKLLSDTPTRVSEDVVHAISDRIAIDSSFFQTSDSGIERRAKRKEVNRTYRWTPFLFVPQKRNADAMNAIRVATSAAEGVMAKEGDENELEWAAKELIKSVMSIPAVDIAKRGIPRFKDDVDDVEHYSKSLEGWLFEFVEVSTALYKDLRDGASQYGDGVVQFDEVAGIVSREKLA